MFCDRVIGRGIGGAFAPTRGNGAIGFPVADIGHLDSRLSAELPDGCRIRAGWTGQGPIRSSGVDYRSFVPSLIVAQQFRPQFGTYRRNLKVKAVAVIKTEQGLTGGMGADGG